MNTLPPRERPKPDASTQSYLRGNIKALTEEVRSYHNSATARMEELGRSTPYASADRLETLLLESRIQTLEIQEAETLIMGKIQKLREEITKQLNEAKPTG